MSPERSFFWLSLRANLGEAAPGSVYRPAVEGLVARMHANRRRVPFPITTNYLDHLIEVAEQVGDDLEVARVHLESAWAAWHMGRPDRCEAELVHALVLLGKPQLAKAWHERGMAYWMYGALARRQPGRVPEALVAWQRALDAYRVLAAPYYLSEPFSSFYRTRCEEMVEDIAGLFRPRPVLSPGAQPAALTAMRRPSDGPFLLPPVTLHAGAVPLLQVLGRIHAGDLRPSGFAPHTTGLLRLVTEMAVFNLDGRMHKLYNLHSDGGDITLAAERSYFLLKVAGDSMNLAGIDPDDYVLLSQQAEADNGDIVAALVIDVDTMATLKRFWRLSNQDIQLDPQSTNPAHQTLVFSPSDTKLALCGVAMGVFKPEL